MLLSVFGLALLSNAKVALQSHAGKHSLHPSADALAFNFLMFSVSALAAGGIMIYEKSPLSPVTVAYGAAFGLLSILFQTLYIHAFRTGPFTLTTMIVSFSSIIPVCISIMILQEPLTWQKVLGLVLTFSAMVILTYQKDAASGTINKPWLWTVLGCFFCSGITSSLQKFHQHAGYTPERSGFVLIAYLTAASITATLFLRQRRQLAGTWHWRPVIALPAVTAGLLLGIYQKLSMYVVSVTEAVFFYPAQQCSAAIVSVLCGVLIFRDKLSRKQLLGLAMGLFAMLLTVQ